VTVFPAIASPEHGDRSIVDLDIVLNYQEY
jgi:hypothetical protein